MKKIILMSLVLITSAFSFAQEKLDKPCINAKLDARAHYGLSASGYTSHYAVNYFVLKYKIDEDDTICEVSIEWENPYYKDKKDLAGIWDWLSGTKYYGKSAIVLISWGYSDLSDEKLDDGFSKIIIENNEDNKPGSKVLEAGGKLLCNAGTSGLTKIYPKFEKESSMSTARSDNWEERHWMWGPKF